MRDPRDVTKFDLKALTGRYLTDTDLSPTQVQHSGTVLLGPKPLRLEVASDHAVIFLKPMSN